MRRINFYLPYSSSRLSYNYTIYSGGDHALTIDFGGISTNTNNLVISLFNHLKKVDTNGVTDIIPAYSSLTMVYDPVQILSQKNPPASAFEYIKGLLEKSTTGFDPSITNSEARQLEIPVCYDTDFAPDLEFVASSHNLSVDEVIAIHTSRFYRVYMIGFLPGFAYMASVDERIATPRKPSPRKRVPAGSVGIAGEQTGIYPLSSPGGWQLIGRTPLQLFDSSKPEPTLFNPGDKIHFYPISLEQYHQLKPA